MLIWPGVCLSPCGVIESGSSPGIKVPTDQYTSLGLVVTDLIFQNGEAVFIVVRGF